MTDDKWIKVPTLQGTGYVRRGEVESVCPAARARGAVCSYGPAVNSILR